MLSYILAFTLSVIIVAVFAKLLTMGEDCRGLFKR